MSDRLEDHLITYAKPTNRCARRWPSVNDLAVGLDCSMERYALEHLLPLAHNQAVIGFLLCLEATGAAVRKYSFANNTWAPVFTEADAWEHGMCLPTLTEALHRCGRTLTIVAVVRTLDSTTQT